MQANVITADPTGVGGVQTHTRITLRLLGDMGIAPRLVFTRATVGGGGAKELTLDAVPALSLPRPRVPFAWTISPLRYRQVWQPADLNLVVAGSAHVGFPLAVRREPFAIWLASLWQDELDTQLAGGDAHARRLLRSPAWPLLRAQEYFVLRRARRVIANSPHTARRLLAALPEIAPRLATITIPVDVARYAHSAQRNATETIVLVVGRLDDERKNIPLALQSFALAARERGDLRLVLAGGGAPASLAELAAGLGIADRVTFTGRVSDEHLVALYQQADMLLLTSRQEGLGLVVLEAMAAGTPVVSTRSGGPEDIIGHHEEIGRLAASFDAPAVARAMLDLLAKPPPQGYAAATMEFVRTHHSLPAAGTELRRILAAAFPERLAALAQERSRLAHSGMD